MYDLTMSKCMGGPALGDNFWCQKFSNGYTKWKCQAHFFITGTSNIKCLHIYSCYFHFFSSFYQIWQFTSFQLAIQPSQLVCMVTVSDYIRISDSHDVCAQIKVLQV